jgi:hypothetical protein
MKRIDIIKQVAEAVGTAHRVDLENYDILILVEIYQVRIRLRSPPKSLVT